MGREGVHLVGMTNRKGKVVGQGHGSEGAPTRAAHSRRGRTQLGLRESQAGICLVLSTLWPVGS